MADEAFVIVASRLRPTDAEMMRLHLESLGIQALVQNPDITAAGEFDSIIGGANLLVPSDHAEEALGILRCSSLSRGRL